MSRLPLFVAVVAALTACSENTSDTAPASGATDAAVDSSGEGSATEDAVQEDTSQVDAAAPVDVNQWPEQPPVSVGGDRPAQLFLPSDYTREREYPLVLLLHGYGAGALAQNAYLGVSAFVDELDFVLVIPDGTQDDGGRRFWNATPACCDFNGENVDDVGYLSGLVEEVMAGVRIDTGRVYSFGHSNGGFMSYRLACDRSDLFTAIASLAGASFVDESLCQPATLAVSVLQIHGTLDDTIAYDGGNTVVGRDYSYPSAQGSVELHAELAGCDVDASEAGDALNVENTIPGDETTTLT
ncbi:MAG: prolyl oligopeptidase family serine peptidase, partial [Myxococcales bacterium]|nr:prolyl oligopeptidase family serine peptidase [Myxococcales bacterium]